MDESVLEVMFTHFAKATTLFLSAIWLLSGPALAGHVPASLTPARAQGFYRDLVHSDSQDFFRRGHERFDQEVQLFNQKRFTSKEPLLKIQQSTQAGKAPFLCKACSP